MDVNIESSWKAALAEEFDKPYFHQLAVKVKEAYSSTTVYPPAKQIFQAFTECPLPQVKVVILGQDPYHGQGQAHGLSFSVPEGVPAPPSLVNILKEIEQELGTPVPTSGNLSRWTQQGVLPLNTVLTVRAHEPQSHRGLGWEQFTDAAIMAINKQVNPVVFMLWGASAQAKKSMITAPQHLVLMAPHPSPLSAYRGFMGCGHFAQANNFLISKGIATINW